MLSMLAPGTSDWMAVRTASSLLSAARAAQETMPSRAPARSRVMGAVLVEEMERVLARPPAGRRGSVPGPAILGGPRGWCPLPCRPSAAPGPVLPASAARMVLRMQALQAFLRHQGVDL